jgi:hypothetical protein
MLFTPSFAGTQVRSTDCDTQGPSPGTQSTHPAHVHARSQAKLLLRISGVHAAVYCLTEWICLCADLDSAANALLQLAGKHPTPRIQAQLVREAVSLTLLA